MNDPFFERVLMAFGNRDSWFPRAEYAMPFWVPEEVYLEDGLKKGEGGREGPVATVQMRGVVTT